MPLTEPCDILLGDGIPSLLWLEYAISYYNVPTIGFDFFLLVPDPTTAADSLRRAGWADKETADASSCDFLVGSSLSHYCLDPPGLVRDTDQKTPSGNGGLPPPPSRGPRPPTTTVLLSMQDFGVTVPEPCPPGNYSYVPPLPLLLDGLISGVLDAPHKSVLERRVALQLVYLYGYCKDIKTSRELLRQLKPENRQFHIDALTGPSPGVTRLLSWGRHVRREFLEGTRQLMYRNSLLDASPEEYQTLIGYCQSEFRPWPWSD